LSVASQTGEDSEVTPEGQTVPAIPNDVSSNGSFSYSVPFDLPEFRGLVPNVSLAYNSSDLSYARERNFTGIGWRLTGFPMIELMSPGGGTPFYSIGAQPTSIADRNIYILDGTPLLACDDLAATNLWTLSYPDEYKTDSMSASCSSGGNFASQHEDYRKILKTTNHWLIYAGDGTEYKYENLAALGATTNPGVSTDYLTNGKWVLTAITDVNGNSVTIQYAVEGYDRGYATTPTAITYAGYSVNFHYKSRPTMLSYALGFDYMGGQNNLLEAIEILDGSSQMRAYDLSYELSSETARNRLAGVTKYGSDYVFENTGNGWTE